MPNEKARANIWLVDEMYQKYLRSPDSVSEAWKEFFSDYTPGFATNAPPAPATPPPASTDAPPKVAEPAPTAPAPAQATEAEAPAPELLKGVAALIAERMDDSLTVPTATSVRSIPAKLLEVNRRIMNNQLQRLAFGGKVSFTHLIGWAVVRALAEQPEMNVAYEVIDDKPHIVRHDHINLGIAIDVPRKDGSRSLLVPNIKQADTMDFSAYWLAYEDVVRRVRANQITPEDFAGTTVSLTNPGTIGTVQSVPRLMPDHGLIVGVGAIAYPAEYSASDPRFLARQGIGRVINMTSTYDHRVIQGAASGIFLARVHQLLLGADGFYDDIFDAMGIPYTPAVWAPDDNPPAGSAAWAEKQAQVFQLINMHRVRGHLIADLDPLRQKKPALHKELDPLTYGLTIWDLDREFATGGLAGKPVMKLGDILSVLRNAYCRTIGVEFMHIPDPEQKAWVQDRLEGASGEVAKEDKIRILRKLNEAEAFETFLHTKYIGHKRFGLEGSESLIPLLDTLLTAAVDDDMDEVAMAMAHRGRLNVLANIIGKSYARVFREFEGDMDVDLTQGSGDVKYHLGATGIHETPFGKKIEVSVAANPSHLEAVDPVLEGIARAKQERHGSHGHHKVLPVLMHGDAAFAGQGVVAETLNLSQLRGYRTGGTVHVVINNQVGFTTSTLDARSSFYATDVAKTVAAPIIHVNGDDPEAVVRATRLAFAFRQAFNKDVVIDMIAYRRRGHNEGDEPSFTQPIMYRIIDATRSVRKLYLERLVNTGVLSLEEGEQLLEEFRTLLSRAFEETKETAAGASSTVQQQVAEADGNTAIADSIVKEIIGAISTLPDGFTVHPKLERIVASRQRMLEEGHVDWAVAEALAMGSLKAEGHWVRLAGEDSQRGTFSHRHAALTDFITGEDWLALQDLYADRARLRIVDSLLSEFAAVGFEYGYSIESPDALVMWEGQFGDFANGAQVIVDQFVSAGEDKWGQRSSLVMLLPHGFEGQGPEHSSARIERYLQSSAENNWRVLVPSTAGSYFHMLRRQVKSSAKKPAIIFTPKSLLRTRPSFSETSVVTAGAFQPVLTDPGFESGRRVVLCSGKVYYDLVARRDELGVDVSVVRLEQLYPLPADEIAAVLESHTADVDLWWAQEEPANMGAWNYVRPMLRQLTGRKLGYAGRAESASPATGSQQLHGEQQAALVERALTGSYGA